MLPLGANRLVVPIRPGAISKVLTSKQPRQSVLSALQWNPSSRSASPHLYRHFSASRLRNASRVRPKNVTGRTRAGVEMPPIPEGTTKTRKFLYTLLASLALGTVAYKVNDPFKDVIDGIYFSGKRIGVISVATVRCFILYKSLLSKKFDSEEDRIDAYSEAHKRAALITRKALESNAGIYIKMGQHISALTYLFPPEWTETMIPLQDKCPVSSIESIRGLIQKDLNQNLEDIFSEFSPTPLGTASFAQVHTARLKSTGEFVAVKVQHPTLEQFVPLDILMTRTVFAMMDYIFPEYPLNWLGNELQSSIYVELDFANEAKNSQRTAAYFKDYHDVTALRVPEVRWAHPRILVMEYLTGGRPDDIKFLEEHNISRADLTSCLAHVFNNMIFTPNVGLHCDPHAGNIAIRPVESQSSSFFFFSPWAKQRNFEIILYDHGLYRDVPTPLRRSYAHFWLALIDKDLPSMKKYAKEFAGISDDEFQLFAAAITGRDFENATTNVVSKRSDVEIQKMTQAVAYDGLLSDIMMLLHKLPRIVLLILKTNDLTRYLDEKLDSPLGPERTFLIMATYCARTVYEESRERIIRQYRKWGPTLWFKLYMNWWGYFRRQSQLSLYDIYVSCKSISFSL